MKRVLDSRDEAEAKAQVGDVVTFGSTDIWKLVCKASSEEEGWMKSTKAMAIGGGGVLVQVSTQQGEQIAEALAFCPGAVLVEVGEQDGKKLWEIR